MPDIRMTVTVPANKVGSIKDAILNRSGMPKNEAGDKVLHTKQNGDTIEVPDARLLEALLHFTVRRLLDREGEVVAKQAAAWEDGKLGTDDPTLP